jgi:hypothetical protein
MSWRIDDHPKGGLQITHLVSPRFTARWTTGDFPIDHMREGAFFWTDEGGAPENSIHLYGFAWDDPAPGRTAFKRLMEEATVVIDRHIINGT